MNRDAVFKYIWEQLQIEQKFDITVAHVLSVFFTDHWRNFLHCDGDARKFIETYLPQLTAKNEPLRLFGRRPAPAFSLDEEPEPELAGYRDLIKSLEGSQTLNNSQIDQFHRIWCALLQRFIDNTNAYSQRAISYYEINKDTHKLLITTQLNTINAQEKKAFYFDIMKEITAIPPVQYDVALLASRLSGSFPYIEQIQLRLKVWELGYNGPFGSTPGLRYKDIIQRLVFYQDSCNTMCGNYERTKVEIRMPNCSLTSTYSQNIDVNSFVEIVCDSQSVISWDAKKKAFKFNFAIFEEKIQELVMSLQIKEGHLLDFLLMVLFHHAESSDWFQGFREKLLKYYYEHQKGQPVKQSKKLQTVTVTPVDLPQLPKDLWQNVLLAVQDEGDGYAALQPMKSVCKTWYSILKNDKFWEMKYINNYGANSVDANDTVNESIKETQTWREKLILRNEVYSPVVLALRSVFDPVLNPTEENQFVWDMVRKCRIQEETLLSQVKHNLILKAKGYFQEMNPELTETQQLYLEYLLVRECGVASFQDTLYDFPNGNCFHYHDVQTWFVAKHFWDRLYGPTLRFFENKTETTYNFSIDYDGNYLYEYQVVKNKSTANFERKDYVTFFRMHKKAFQEFPLGSERKGEMGSCFRMFLESLAIIYDLNPDIMSKIVSEDQKWLYQTPRYRECYEKLVSLPWKKPTGEDSDSEDEEEEKPKKKAPTKKTPAKKANKKESDEDDEEEEEMPKMKPAKRKATKKQDSDDDDDDYEEEKPKKKKKAPAKKKAAKKKESDDDDDDDYQEEKPKKTRSKRATKKKN